MAEEGGDDSVFVEAGKNQIIEGAALNCFAEVVGRLDFAVEVTFAVLREIEHLPVDLAEEFHLADDFIRARADLRR